ncbi:hypothetical protein [Cohnella sp. JJ-181]|uniref:hypothetical protein n=1 Tax=Cohnella rhizoplanae TaxID=2974897 RepID=UPI0022FF9390|nr:hypothetical protein [Cohnella sp. JJ-181]CAI6057722.1 hypothetical protein COHCIP112018_01747 [Cohnella sp. JJ-181]
MSEERPPTAWDKFVEARRHALSQDEKEPEVREPMSMDELERAIAETAAASGLPETGMPPRAVVHPSARKSYSKWFYRLLLLLFSALVGFLLWWGYEHYSTV